MSRNKEKAQSLLNQFHDKKALDLGYLNINKLRRPRNVARVTDLPMAEKWRGQVNQEINAKVTRLYDEMLSDYQIRDLNDEVNRLFREKTAWEHRIKELGGPNYLKFSQSGGQGGKNEFMVRNYRYFGRAKELKEVKQLMEVKAKEAASASRSKNSEVEYFNKKLVYDKMNKLGADYYGFLDGDDDADDAIGRGAGEYDDEVDAEVAQILGEEFVPKGTKMAILRENGLSIDDDGDSGVPEQQGLLRTNLQSAENSASNKLVQILNQQYSSSGREFKEPDELLTAVTNTSQVPSVEDVEKFLVDRKRKVMLERLSLQ